MNKISRWKFPADKTYKTKNTHLTYLCYIVFFIAYQNKIQQKHVQMKHKNGKRKQYIYMLFCLQDQQFRSWHLLKKWMWNPWWTTSASSRKTIKDPSLFWGFIIIIFLYFFKIFCQKGKLPFFLNFFQRERPILGLLALHSKDTEWEGKRKRERQSSEKSQSKDGIETCCTKMRQQTKVS